MADLECGCRIAPVRRLCSYHEGYEDAVNARPDDEAIKAVLLFADGLTLSETCFTLADMFNEDCPQAAVLRWAGCHGKTPPGFDGDVRRRSPDG